MLPTLITAATNKEIEEKAMPMYFANLIACKISGETATTSYEDFINSITAGSPLNRTQQPQKSGEQIINDILPYVMADKKNSAERS